MNLRELASTIKVTVAGFVAAILIKLLYSTIRWKWIVEGGGFGAAPSGGVVTFWHSSIVMAPVLYRRARTSKVKGSCMLISQHGDGRIIATAVRLLGIGSVAGSSSRGGQRALRELIKKGREGYDIGFTPDGPRGPRHVCKDGVVLAAMATQLPVCPIAYSVDRRWQLRSWDGMIIPKPFSRGVVIVGAPIVVSEGDDRESARVRIQEVLDEITERANRHWAAA